MNKGAAPEAAPAPDTSKKKDKDKDKDKAPEVQSHYPFEDLFFLDLPAAAAGQPQRLRRAFAVSPGEYDVYIAIKERAGAGAPAASPGTAGTSDSGAASMKMGAIKQSLTVPDFSTEFTTSSIIVADKVEVLQSPLAERAAGDQPLHLWPDEDHAVGRGEVQQEERALGRVLDLRRRAATRRRRSRT